MANARDTTMRGAQPGESPKERVDRELKELLEEIRVMLPGVEILFGFLIIVPFQAADKITGHERVLYLAAFLAVSAALALLISPGVHHRLRFRELDKERWVFLSNRMVIGASALLALAISLTVYLVVLNLVGGRTAATIAAVNAAWFIWLWFGVPLLSKARERG